jgi:hypothetical protein
MNSIGDVLRSERLRLGVQLDQVTECTRIGQHLLQAIEQNRFDRLPGGLLTRSFIRQYARALNLDDEQIIASFKKQFEEPIVQLPALSGRRPSVPLMPSLIWLAVVSIVAGGIYALWESVRQGAPDAPSTPVHLAQVGAQPAALVEKWTQTRQEPAAPVENNRSVLPANIGVMRVVFSAREPVWISIESDGRHVYDGMLEGQQRKELEASGKMVALVGNAGGLEVSLNGNPIGSLGEHGQVRLVELTPGATHIVSRRSDQ